MPTPPYAIIVAALLAAGCATESHRPVDSPLQAALSALLQADAREALRIFDAIDTPITAKQKAAVDCIRARFGGTLPPSDLPPGASAALVAYEKYWRAVMLKADSPETAQAKLLAALNAIPTMAGAHDHASLDSVS